MHMDNHQREKEHQNEGEHEYECNHSCLIVSREVHREIYERYLRYFAVGDNNLMLRT